jgi:hypothetical protein
MRKFHNFRTAPPSFGVQKKGRMVNTSPQKRILPVFGFGVA